MFFLKYFCQSTYMVKSPHFKYTNFTVILNPANRRFFLCIILSVVVCVCSILKSYASEENLPPIPVLEKRLEQYKAEGRKDTSIIELLKDLADAYADIDLQKSISYTQDA